jgi:hypothetical protein
MRIIEMDKSNWSGEKFTLKIRKDGTFDVYGETFKVKVKSFPEAGQAGAILVKDRMGWREIARGFRLEGDKQWGFSYSDISREDEIPEVAAAQLIFNIW